MRRALTASLALLAVAPGLGAAAGEPSGSDLAGCAAERVHIRDDHWVRLTPSVGAGPTAVRSFDAAVRERDRLYATDGRAVRITRNGGCTWDDVTPPEDPGVAATTPSYTHVAAAGRTGLWLAGWRGDGEARGPVLRRTPDATPTPGFGTAQPYEAVEVGLPPLGTPVQLVVSQAESFRDTAYLLVEQPPDVTTGNVLKPSRHLYRTHVDDVAAAAGLPHVTWRELAPPPDFGVIEGVVGSPVNPAQVWIWSHWRWATATVARDGTARWVAGRAAEPIATIDVDGRGVAAVYARSGEGGSVSFVAADGRSAGGRAAPVTPVAATHGTRPGVVAVSGEDRTYGYDVRAGRWVDVTPAGVPSFTRLRIARGSDHGILLGQAPDGIYRFDLYPSETFLPPPPGREGTPGPPLPGPPGSDLARTAFTPREQSVTVAPGGVADAPVDFGVRPAPTPLDVFFILDTTASMDPAIRGMQAGVKRIAYELTRALGRQVCIGLGDVKDYRLVDHDRVWRVPQPVAACDLDGVQRAVDGIKQAYGGDTEEAEAQTLALVQAVTGAGVNEPPVVIPRGLDAKFRTVEDVFKVIVLISDASFKQTGPYPTIPEAVRALSDHDTKFVGVVAQTENDSGAARTDMEAVAAGTDTRAPAAGVDCNGDRRPDLAEGDPLVCLVEDVEPDLAPSILRLLLGVPLNRQVDVEVTDPHAVVREVTGSLRRIVNLKVENHLRPTVTVGCTPAQDGLDLPVRLVGRVRGRVADTARILVRCRSLPVPLPPDEPPPVPDDVERRPPLPPVVPPVEIPAPVTHNAPGNLNPNAGLSHEEEQQVEVATAMQGTEEDDAVEVELAMSGPRRSEEPAVPLALGAAAVVSAAGSFVVAARRRAAARPATASRSGRGRRPRRCG